ncbi:unnamed protein product [Blepharisma stoltei]|uniref:Uncharacterized protein n=1 Tax=Blepharisma stoltei TaxID=1481888 RepID=A0AAU9J617_9CILI|nr:unnamed protein product [Blepharisma stoltei]
MIRRAFATTLHDFIKFDPKRKLPQLNREDSDRAITDVAAFFDYIMAHAGNHKSVANRKIIGLPNLRKLAILANKPEDAKVLQSAFWTYCGHHRWPDTNTIEMLSQAMINIDAPADASDFFLYHHKILFYPRLQSTNNFFKALHDKSLWEPLRNAFKVVEVSNITLKNELTYIMGINACVQLKDWKWASRFYERGAKKIDYSEGFLEVIQELRSNLTEEELKKFSVDKQAKQ